MGRGKNDSSLLQEETVGTIKSTAKERQQRWEDFKQEKINIMYCQSQEDVDRAMNYLYSLDLKTVALDFETSSKNGRFGVSNGALRLVQIGFEDKEAGIEPTQIIIDCLHTSPAKALRKMLRSQDIEKQIHYMDFEQEWAQVHLGTHINNVYDTCLAFQEIQKQLRDMEKEDAIEALPGWSNHDNKLSTLIRRYLGMDMPKEEQTGDWGRRDLSPQQVIYATMDVVCLPPLAERVKQIAKQTGAEDNIRKRSKWAARRISERAARGMKVHRDDSARFLRAVKRSRSLQELQELKELARQLTIYSQNRDDMNSAYKKKRQELKQKS